MTNPMGQDLPANHRPSDEGASAGVFAVAIIPAFFAAIAWGLIRAYTGVFDVLNLRVYVASMVLVLPLFLLPAFA